MTTFNSIKEEFINRENELILNSFDLEKFIWVRMDEDDIYYKFEDIEKDQSLVSICWGFIPFKKSFIKNDSNYELLYKEFHYLQNYYEYNQEWNKFFYFNWMKISDLKEWLIFWKNLEMFYLRKSNEKEFWKHWYFIEDLSWKRFIDFELNNILLIEDILDLKKDYNKLLSLWGMNSGWKDFTLKRGEFFLDFDENTIIVHTDENKFKWWNEDTFTELIYYVRIKEKEEDKLYKMILFKGKILEEINLYNLIHSV
jgi:hypothetical protein